ncbi:MAG: hypothetical protein GC192_15740 [Bacteroidetes bacterium]|nr:hypothetical protein [Bacteroidota bacterium]
MRTTLFHSMILLGAACVFGCKMSRLPAAQQVHFIQDESKQQVDVYIGSVFFTSYIYRGGSLKKPVLFPLETASGITVTRGYPLDTRPGERMDHPHHYGLWFNHGDVNGLDFWNNSDAISPQAKDYHYGTIIHEKILKMEDGDQGILEVKKAWVTPKGDTILDETTAYVFSGKAHQRQIEHRTTLTAREKKVVFKDSKEGMFAMRVARELEHPDQAPVILTNTNLEPDSPKVDITGVTGHYLNSEGLEGEATWGKRAKWVQLSGKMEGSYVAIVIMDAPENPNYPPHWMTRGYGLFGVNPFGSAVYSEGKEELNYELLPGKSVDFRHQVLIVDGETPKKEALDIAFLKFAGNQP